MIPILPIKTRIAFLNASPLNSGKSDTIKILRLKNVEC